MENQNTNTQLSKVKDSTQWRQVANFLIINFEKILFQLPKKTGTILTYQKDAKDFIKFIEGTGLNFNSLRQFRKHLEQRRDIGAKTKNKKLTVARTLLIELYSHYRFLEEDISRGVPNFKIESGHVKDGVNDFEMTKLKSYIEQIEDVKKRTRIKAMFCLLVYQGLRQFEVCEVEVQDINLYDCTLKVMAKGSDSKKPLNLHPMTCKALTDYMRMWQRKDGFLFFSISHINTIEKKDGTDKLTTSAIRYIWNDRKYGILKKAGVYGRSVHGFRHFFVTRMLEATGGDILAVMKFSRHKSFEAVKAYDDRKSEKELLPVYHKAF